METKYVIHQKGETFVVYDASLTKRKSQNKRRWGFFLLNLSLTGLLIFLTPILIAEMKYRYTQVTDHSEARLSGFGQLLWLDQKGILSPDNWDFSLIIPMIKINALVENSVDLKNENDYDGALKTGVAHAKGSALPGQPGTIYIFGHSTDYPWNITRYSAFFYPLQYLNGGEEVIIVYQGQSYLYEVKEKRVANANDLEYLVSRDNEDKLVLQTCWPPGTTWKRLIVIAEPIEKT